MSLKIDTPTICPQCGAPAAGSPADGWLFCTSCGASLAQSRCASCGAAIAPGARFCHKCGAPTGVGGFTTPRTAGAGASILPWAVTGVALLALIALLVGRGLSRPGSSSDAAASQSSATFESVPPPGRASTDISQLSPEERADRLFNRVMLLSSEGKTDSVQFFAPMAIAAFEQLGPLNADQRYDLGRIAEASGALPLARAQADSIRLEQPSHLLGLVLAARVALLARDGPALRQAQSRLLAVERAELARGLPEYQRHEADIMSALAQARRGAR